MQMLFEKTCVLCHADQLTLRKRKSDWFSDTPECYVCENCGTTFMEDELRWKLVDTRDRGNPIWREFNQQSLYVREWMSIGKLAPRPSPFDSLEACLPFMVLVN